MDSRWQNLPHTDTKFEPNSYSDKAWEIKNVRS